MSLAAGGFIAAADSAHDARLTLCIAGLTIDLLSRDSSLRPGIEGAAARFVVPSRMQADLTLEARWSDLAGETGETLFDSGGVWQLYRSPAGGERLRLFTAGRDVPYRAVELDESLRSGVIWLDRDAYAHAGEVVFPLEYPLDELLMVRLLATGRGAELHSCAIVDTHGRGHLFVGVSGAGKTTTARVFETLAPGSRVLSDDRNVVREQEGTFWVYGTPWHGEAELSEAARAPLHRVYLLEQAAATELLPCSTSEAVMAMFSCAFPLFHQASSIDFTLDVLQAIAERVGVRRLRFRPDRSMIAAVL